MILNSFSNGVIANSKSFTNSHVACFFHFKQEQIVDAMHFCGFYTEEYLSFVPKGIALFSLSQAGEELIEENGVEKVADYIAANMNATVAKTEGVN